MRAYLGWLGQDSFVNVYFFFLTRLTSYLNTTVMIYRKLWNQLIFTGNYFLLYVIFFI